MTRSSVIVIALLLSLTSLISGQNQTPPGEWRFYASDAAGIKYSALDQINKANVKNVRLVWRW